jgi:hypothetical protein
VCAMLTPTSGEWSAMQDRAGLAQSAAVIDAALLVRLFSAATLNSDSVF